MAVTVAAWRKIVAAARHGRIIALDQQVEVLEAARAHSIIN